MEGGVRFSKLGVGTVGHAPRRYAKLLSDATNRKIWELERHDQRSASVHCLSRINYFGTHQSKVKTMDHIKDIWHDPFTGRSWMAINVVIGESSDKEILEWFGENPSDISIVQLPAESKWPDVLAAIGIFKSKSQARKNGWNKEVDLFWEEAEFKKKKIKVFVMNTDRRIQ